MQDPILFLNVSFPVRAGLVWQSLHTWFFPWPQWEICGRSSCTICLPFRVMSILLPLLVPFWLSKSVAGGVMCNKIYMVKPFPTCSNLNISVFEIWDTGFFFLQYVFSHLGFVPPFKNKQTQHGSKVVFLLASLLPTSHSSLPGFLPGLEAGSVLPCTLSCPLSPGEGTSGWKKEGNLVMVPNLEVEICLFSLRKWLLEKRRQTWPWSQEGILIPPNGHSAEVRQAWVWEVFPGGEKFCSEARSAWGWLCKYLRQVLVSLKTCS